MIKKVKLVQLHEPLFLAGVNFGNKLQPRSGKGHLELTHDDVSDHVIVNFNGQIAHIKNWASFNEETPELETTEVVPIARSAAAVKAQASGPGLGLKFQAQVETPIDKVQGKPGRKAKYQGEESQGE
jgi:hypothetical protein